MRHWELPFGREKWRTDNNFGRIGISDLESLHIGQLLDDPKFRNFNGFPRLSGIWRSRSNLGAGQAGPGVSEWPSPVRELGPGRPFVDLLPKCFGISRKAPKFLGRARKSIDFLDFY